MGFKSHSQGTQESARVFPTSTCVIQSQKWILYRQSEITMRGNTNNNVKRAILDIKVQAINCNMY